MRRLLLSIIAIVCLSVNFAVAADKKFVLVIDAGHGGHDPGAKGVVAYEKNVNLKVALAFGRYVEKNCPDVKVIYTRTTDVFIPLNERANIANRNKADLFISIHSNSLPAGKISRGFETYTLGMHRAADNLEVAKRENSVILIEKNYKQRYAGFDPNSAESYIMFELMQDKNMANSVELAKMIQRETCALTGRQNKGVHQAGFLVLRATSMPSCLIELGFISTPDEEQYLNSASGQDALAHGIFNAFVKYKNKHHRANTVSLQTSSQKESNGESATPVKNDTRVKNNPPVKNVTPVKNNPPVKNENTPFVSSVEPIVEKTNSTDTSKPVFKVQIIASNRSLRPGSAQFQGETQVESFIDGNMVKYTMGNSTDYNEILRLRRSLAQKFPDCFVVAFRDGAIMDINQAITLFKSNKK